MPVYPFCMVSDVEAELPHLGSFSASTKPTLDQVTEFVLEISQQIQSIANSVGYGDFHETSTTIAGAITAGDNKTVTVADATGFAKGDLIKIEGLTSGVRAWEFTEIESISSSVFTIDVANSYDASSVTVYLVNGALINLRKINAIGGAWRAAAAQFGKVSPNRSDKVEELKELYFGNEENMSGLWAIRNIQDYLTGATTGADTPESRSQIASYQEQNSTEDDIDAKVEIDQKW